MLGRTHYKLGIGYYLISIPMIATVFAINKAEHLLFGILVAGFAALLPDIDTANSKINTQNIITRIPIKLVDKITTFLLLIVRCGLSFWVAYLLWMYSQGQSDTSKDIIQVIAIILALLGVLGSGIIKRLPFYSSIEKNTINFGNRLKKIIIYVVIIILVSVVYVYNYRVYNDWGIYLLGVVLILSAISEHRTFTHSLEGFLTYSILAYHITTLYGYTSIGIAFIIGYMSHLYLADIFVGTYINIYNTRNIIYVI